MKMKGVWALSYRHPKYGWMSPYYIPNFHPMSVIKKAYNDYVQRWGKYNVECKFIEER